MPTGTIMAPEDPAVLSKAEQRTLMRLEKRIAAGLQTFREVGQALLEIRDSRLYRETHATFEAYCQDRWALPRSRAYQLIDSAKVVNALGDPSDLTNEAQARELATLDDPAQMKTVWAAAEQRAEKENRPMTAALIRQVRTEVAPGNGASAFVRTVDTPTERLMASMVRLGQEFTRWRATKPHIGERQKVKAAWKALTETVGL